MDEVMTLPTTSRPRHARRLLAAATATGAAAVAAGAILWGARAGLAVAGALLVAAGHGPHLAATSRHRVVARPLRWALRCLAATLATTAGLAASGGRTGGLAGLAVVVLPATGALAAAAVALVAVRRRRVPGQVPDLVAGLVLAAGAGGWWLSGWPLVGMLAACLAAAVTAVADLSRRCPTVAGGPGTHLLLLAGGLAALGTSGNRWQVVLIARPALTCLVAVADITLVLAGTTLTGTSLAGHTVGAPIPAPVLAGAATARARPARARSHRAHPARPRSARPARPQWPGGPVAALAGHSRAARGQDHPRWTHAGAGRAGWCEAGSVTVEMTILVVPLLVTLALFTALCARGASAAIDVHAAAAAAARSASLASDPAAARTAAITTATASLGGDRARCADLTVTVDTADFSAGGTVTVTLACAVTLDDLGLPGVGATRTIRATSTAPLDVYRPFAPE